MRCTQPPALVVHLKTMLVSLIFHFLVILPRTRSNKKNLSNGGIQFVKIIPLIPLLGMSDLSRTRMCVSVCVFSSDGVRIYTMEG